MRQQKPRTLTVAVDGLISLMLAVFAVVWANQLYMASGTLEDFLEMRVTLLNAIFAIVFVVLSTKCSSALGMYRGDFTDWLRAGFKAVTSCGIMTTFVAVYLLLRKSPSPIAIILLEFFISICVYQLVRLAITNRGLRSTQREFEQVLILGSGRRAIKAWKELRVRYHGSKRLIGFVDDRDPHLLPAELEASYVCDIDRLSEFLLHHVVDELIIAVPMRSCYDLAQRAVSIAEAVGVRVLTLNDTYGLSFSKTLRARAPLFTELIPKDERLITAESVKRAFDVVAAGIGLILVLPIFAAIAIAIKLTGPGPIFFVQKRYGYRRRLFPMWKFRSMVSNAPDLMASLESQNEANGPIFKIKNDPRITPLGKFLRSTSLDELPQLWNVLVGDMSLVGPRPMSIRDVSRFTEAQLMRRFSVRPGITGIWQVSGRSSLNFEQWITLDFAYLDEWSLALDLKILARTVPAVLKRSGSA
ncbi:sugar transferase [Alloacidobacterium dinghuense]|uniref:Sugar transferase n=1 Tax=Alloacidobacterium dinghuense TaxID=2763107 RepID=A0A7G8BI69_9BACT|nr:sugar transferase [Alloacidobacterium dinghuense]QNI32239.1 sugar transferase [Alloacidobacterium dinghuense]